MAGANRNVKQGKELMLLLIINIFTGTLILFSGLDHQAKIKLQAENPSLKKSYTDNVLGHWEFKDSSNPGKDSSRRKNNLVVNGSPQISNKTISLRGGSTSIPKKEQDYLYTESPIFDLGDDSFSVECWIKTSNITHLELVGTRSTIRPIYPTQIGWALGVSGSKSAIIFLTNDNRGKCTVAKKNLFSSSWDDDDWNYLVGIRDRKAKKLYLYLNGKLVKRKRDRAKILTPSKHLRIGYDYYSGSLTQGKLKNIRITKKVLSAAAIAQRYRAGLTVAGNLPPIIINPKSTTAKGLKIDFTDGLDNRLQLQPTPVKIKYSQKYSTLKTPVYIKIPAQPTQQEIIAKNFIIKDFKTRFNITVKLLNNKKTSTATVIQFGQLPKTAHSESYKLNIDRSNIELRSNDHGVIYAALTLIEIIEQSSLINKSKISLPNKLAIYDYPAVAHRIQVGGGLSKLKGMSKAAMQATLQRTVRTRLNYETLDISEPINRGFKAYIKIAKEYGVNILARIGYNHECKVLKHSVRLEDIPSVMKKFTAAAQAGCQGLTMHFDDLDANKRAMMDYPGTVGKFQQKFLIELQKVAKDNKIKFINVCPTTYFRSWQQSAKIWFKHEHKYKNYFKELTQLPGGDIEMFYTDISPKALDDLKSRGVNKIAYYLNGLWTTPLWFTFYAGPSRLAWSWYGFFIDSELGPKPYPEMMKAFKNLTKNNIQTVWVGNGSFEGSLMAGIWLWNPAAFNEPAAVKAVNRMIGFGPGTYQELLVYEKNMLPFVALFKTYRNRWTAEFGVKVKKGNKPLTQQALITYWEKFQTASQALNNIKSIQQQRKNIVERPYRLPYTADYLTQMQDALEVIKLKLMGKLQKNNITIGAVK